MREKERNGFLPVYCKKGNDIYIYIERVDEAQIYHIRYRSRQDRERFKVLKRCTVTSYPRATLLRYYATGANANFWWQKFELLF